ncbi:MAG TPA: carboxypeptidase-like regulatory domain-containing protein, partial [Candidatus Methanomethylicus sp.]|nr:carboxypeptidase-like regulatory domain-containing protein [Candidatus Methanomethylicus sp.]
MANALVTLVSLETNLTVAETLSDAGGAFIFNTDIRNGTYNISAIPFRHPYTFAAGYTGNTTSGILAVEGLTSSGIIVQMGRSCSVSGTVTESPSGGPLEGISIVAMKAGTIVGYVKTGQDGKYNISSNLPEGTYNVTVASPVGFIYRTSTGMRTLALTLQQGATVDYSLSRSAALSGYVTYSNGMPAPGIPVFCFSLDYSYAGSAYTNGSGYYQINSGLGTGTYGAVANNDVSNRKVINLVQNHASSMNFTLTTSGATKGYVTGVVLSSSGSPIAGANISHSSGWTTSDSNGSYLVEVTLPEGQSNATLLLTCSAKGYVEASVDVAVYAGLYSHADFSLQRSPSGAIAGRVLSAGTSPIKGDASLTLEVAPATVNLGASVGISGALSVPVAGTITVWWSINGSGFEDSITCELVGGAYSCHLIPSATGEYSFKAQWAGDASYNPAESPEAHASVLAPATKQNSSLSIVAAPGTVNVGSNATINGSISPAVAATVSIYMSINGSAMAHLQDVDATDGAFSIKVNLTQV